MIAALIWAFTPQPVIVEVAEVTKGRFEQTIDEDGKTRVRERYVVSAPLAGRVRRATLKAGDAVARGDIVAVMHPAAPPLLDARTERELEERVGAAEAALARAKTSVAHANAALAQNRADAQRTQKLAAQGFVSPTQRERDDLKVTLSAREAEAANFEQHAAEHQLELARAALTRSRQGWHTAGGGRGERFDIRSPVAGRVLRRVRAGQTPAPASVLVMFVAQDFSGGLSGKLVDVAPDGTALNLCEGIIRARYRNSLAHAELLEPGRTYPLTIEIGATAKEMQDQVADPIENENVQVTVAEAQRRNPEAQVGDFLTDELPPIDFGRVAAQTAKQVITQRMRESERKRQYEEFKDKVGEIVSGVVKRVDYGNITVDLQRAEGVIRRDETIPRESLRVNDRVRAYIFDVREEPRGPQIFLSRTHPQFMAKLFTQEVPEIYDGIIEIKAAARDPGSRAKIGVISHDSSIDPVGACVGMRGSRVQAVVQELQGEKVDIIPWSQDTANFIVNALAPAEVSKVLMDEESNKAEVVVPDDQLSLAIGRRGQNVKLASQLTGWEIDIMTEAEESERRQKETRERTELFKVALDVDDVIAHLLVAEGYATVEDVADAAIEDLQGVEGFDEAKVMAAYLIERGVPSGSIVVDSAGVNTMATGRNVAAIAAARRVLAVLRRDGDTAAIEDQLATFNDREVAVDTKYWNDAERKYMADE